MRVAGRSGRRRAAGLALLALLVGGCGLAIDGGEESAAPTAGEPRTGVVHRAFRETEIGVTLARYDVTADGELVGKRTSVAAPERLHELRDDVALHREAWSLWWGLAPEPWRSDVVRLLIATDGRHGILASVAPLDDELADWTLHIDPAELTDRELLTETLVHELAHVFSLRDDQVRTSVSAPYGWETIADARSACAPDVGIEDGCLHEGAYLEAYIDEFWPAPALRRADVISASDDPDRAAAAFYDEDPSRFLNEYAATHPTEDFAEAWVTFVLYEYEGRDEPWARKAAWFAAHPELVEARGHIWRLLDIGP